MPRNETETRIGIGYTDGSRFVGITPSLQPQEANVLIHEGVFGSLEQVEEVESDPPATLIRLTADNMSGETATYRVKATANNVALILKRRFDTRKSIKLDTQVVELTGPGSSPFHPNTDGRIK